MESARPRILIFIDHYLPGYKVGGPVRSVANFVDRMGDRFQISIVCRDHDFTDPTPYPGIEVGQWNQVGQARVRYVPSRELDGPLIARLIAEVEPAVVYLNGYFSPLSRRILLLRRFGKTGDVPVVLAPRGELGARVLRMKRLKKWLYLTLAARLGLHKGLLWQATATHEVDEIRARLGKGTDVRLAANLPRAVPPPSDFDARPPKRPGVARLVFLSRISPKKNLPFALEALRELRGDVTFDIYGPIDSEPAWQACEEVIATLPANIRVTYQGSIDNERVVATLQTYDFLVLPTLNENFGHAIFESFVAGCPVVLSDQTPWRDLAAKNVGWDLSLSDLQAWRCGLQECVDMDNSRHREMSTACVELAQQWPTTSKVLQMNLDLFHEAVQSSGLSQSLR